MLFTLFPYIMGLTILCVILCLKIVVNKSWHIPWTNGHRGEVDKGALPEVYGAKVQGTCGNQRSRGCSDWGQWLGLGEHLLFAPSSSLQYIWDPRSPRWIQVIHLSMLFVHQPYILTVAHTYMYIYIVASFTIFSTKILICVISFVPQ